MHKLLVLLWSLAACLLAVGFLHPVAFDAQPSSTTWCQLAVATGSVRLMAVHGDPSTSQVASAVFQREKDTWRNVVSGDMWGRYDNWSLPVDVPGTVMTTYRLDVPLAWSLILIPMLPAGLWALKRYWAPPRLVWKELRVRSPKRSRLSSISGRLAIAGFLSVAITAMVVRSVSYSGLPSGLSYYCGWGAVVLPLTRSDAELWEGPPRAPTLAARERFESGSSMEQYLSVEVLLGGDVAFRSFITRPKSRQAIQRWSHEIAGLRVSTITTPGPTVLGYWSSTYLSQIMRGTSARPTFAGVERSIIIPITRLAMLMLIYPFIRFFRGPLRRARRRADGCCRWCGYDLTGNESGVCSECGEVATYPT